MQATMHIPGYDSLEQIALGGMATVYKARKKSIDKPVAIKVLYPHLAADTRFIARFKHEAHAAASVQHDNIVNVLDYGDFSSSYYIVMEYFEGMTLGTLLTGGNPQPLDIVFAIVLNVAYGLEAAHKQKLVHRDIKPDNTILTVQGGVKIADFGLARSIEKVKLMTHAGKVIGTPAYMSPEQARADIVTSQSDLFSLGVLAYELLTGQRPFGGESYSEVVDQIQSKEEPPPSSLNPLVEPVFDEIVAKMLAKNVRSRYQRASEITMDLEEALDKFGLRLGRRNLVDFCSDPIEYAKKFSTDLLKKLRAAPPKGDGRTATDDATRRYLKKIVYLDPDGRAEQKKLKALGDDPVEEPKTGPQMSSATMTSPAIDDDAECKVYLMAIDRNMETPESFALKLSMRIKSPLPRVKCYVNATPSVIGGNIPIRKARKLIRVIEGLGGTARMELVEEETLRPAQPATEEMRPQSGQPKTTENSTDVVGSEPHSGYACPVCGWKGDADVTFCSRCKHDFRKTDPLGPDEFNRLVGQENSLEIDLPRPLLPLLPIVQKAAELPLSIQIGGGATIVIILLLIIFGR